jgi:hypothetical protein
MFHCGLPARDLAPNTGTTPQTTVAGTAFPNALAVTVTDTNNNPLTGVNVTFTAPASGASGTFNNSTATIVVATNGSGVASAPFTANGAAGGPYTVTAAATGQTTVNFLLTNIAGMPSTMTANSGTTPQSTVVNTPFPNALAVTVKDANNNPVDGVNVTFTALASGTSGTFSNSNVRIVEVTNGSGVASAPFIANGVGGGPYTVTAATGLITVNFSLTNNAPILSSPPNGAVGVPLNAALRWMASYGATSYDVYFGTSPTPPFAAYTTSTSYSPGTLVTDTTYYWQIVARNSGGTTSSLVWSFTTQLLAGNPVTPVLDLNGDSNQDVFLYDPFAGTGYAGLSNGSGGFTYVYNAFTPGFDTIRYGNFNSSGDSGLVAYNSSSTLGYTLVGTGTGTFTPVSLFWGPGFTKVAAGDLNGEGLTDFVICRPTDGTSYTAISNGDGTFRYQYALVSIGFTHMVVADFNGDGKADVFFYRSSDGLAFLGIGNGTGGFTFSPVTLGAGYAFVESGDINGDGKTDLLLYSSNSGAAVVGLSTGSSFAFTPYSYSPGFTTVKLLDFNGDGKADVALYNMNNTLGYLGVGSGTGTFTFSSLFWGAGMTNVDTLDLNGDGKIDIVIYNTTNGASYTGISSGNAANPFTYQYAYWGNGKVLATTAAQP